MAPKGQGKQESCLLKLSGKRTEQIGKGMSFPICVYPEAIF